MANIKISQLPVGTTPLSGTEVVPIVQNGQTVQVPVSDVGATATPGYIAEDEANKTQDVSLDGTSTVKYPSAKATKDYADSLVVGLLDDRGSYTPSVTSPGPYPSTGGSGAGGAIEKGDIWFVAANGYIGTTAVSAGMSIRALSNNPGQTALNWDLIDYSLGYTPENINNKITTAAQMTTFASSTVKYPAVKAVKDYIDAKPDTLQEILNANHDLANGINTQGTNAGDTMGGTVTDINAFGTDAASGNQGFNVNAFGASAANLNQADDVNAFGLFAAKQNDGISVNAFGNGAALLNLGNNVNAFGSGTATNNSASNVIAIGDGAGANNSGTNVVALGLNAGAANPFNNVVLLGNGAQAQANNQFVHRGTYTGIVDYNNLNDNHVLNFPDADGTPVMKINGQTPNNAGEVILTAGSGTATTIKVTLSSLDLLNLNTIPIQILPSIGGKIIIPLRVVYKYNYNTTNYNGGILYLSFTNGSWYSSFAQYVNYTGNFGSYQLIATQSFTTTNDLAGASIAAVTSNPITNGDGTLDIYFTYDTVTA